MKFSIIHPNIVKNTGRFTWLVGGLLALMVSAADTDPVYQGKSLSRWFAEFSEAPAYVTPATKAIQELGSNAVPCLVQFLKPTETNSWRKRAAISALDYIGTNASASVSALMQCLEDPDLKVQADAVYALPKVGSAAKTAIPVLKDYLKKHGDPYYGFAAAVALWRIDRQQVPVIVPALTNMLMANGQFDFDADVIGLLTEIGPAARAALPILKLGLKEADAEYRELIRETIEKIQGEKKDEPNGPANASQPRRLK